MTFSIATVSLLVDLFLGFMPGSADRDRLGDVFLRRSVVAATSVCVIALVAIFALSAHPVALSLPVLTMIGAGLGGYALTRWWDARH